VAGLLHARDDGERRSSAGTLRNEEEGKGLGLKRVEEGEGKPCVQGIEAALTGGDGFRRRPAAMEEEEKGLGEQKADGRHDFGEWTWGRGRRVFAER
jgi:hypothetical protein